jgi:Ca2+/Na+ antiporter
MLDNSTPQIRALVKTVFFILSLLVTMAVVMMGTEIFGLATVTTAVAVLVLAYLIYLVYSITLGQEQYRDTLNKIEREINQ